MMSSLPKTVSAGVPLPRGATSVLAQQLGSTADLATAGVIAAGTPVGRIVTLPGLRSFLRHYQEHLLLPLEFPAIIRASQLTRSGKIRELLALDLALAREPALREFAQASQHAGRTQLRRLRPLRDHRVVQRYLQAVEQGGAHGWHTLVYGLTLGVYALPLRTGLLGYAHQTTASFIESAHRTVDFSEAAGAQCLADLSCDWPAAIAAALPPDAFC